ncbi:hypothetical protein ACWH9Q_22785, partial [Bacillus subtilis]
HAGDVEQGRQREVDGRLGQAEPGALPLGVVHDVAVGAVMNNNMLHILFLSKNEGMFKNDFK